MIKKIFAVWVYVNNLEQSRNFYENILGLRCKFIDAGWVEYDLGATLFALLQRPKEKGLAQPQKTHIMLAVDDLNFVKKVLLDNKVQLIGDIREEAFGKLLTFVDPNGHWMELFEPKICNNKELL